MAGDWIKMRVWLKRDPKVIRMADYLAGQREFMDWLTDPVQQSCKNTAYEHVTSDVTRDVTVASLLEVWGVTREQGRRENDDLVVDHCEISALDEICGVPTFGAAMEFVEWAIEEKYTAANGVESERVRFPKFFKDQVSPEEKHRSGNAERQARYRAKKGVTSDVTHNVTVTDREEKRREENKDSLSPAREDVPVFDCTIPTAAEVEAYAETLCYRIDGQAFLDHYAAAGWRHKGHPIADWRALVRTWKRREEERGHQTKVQPPRRLTAAERLAVEGPSNG